MLKSITQGVMCGFGIIATSLELNIEAAQLTFVDWGFCLFIKTCTCHLIQTRIMAEWLSVSLTIQHVGGPSTPEIA